MTIKKKIMFTNMLFKILNIIGIVIIFSLGYLIGNYNVSTNFTIQDVCLRCSQVYGEKDYQTMNLTKLFNKINEKCGNSHIYKKYNDNEYSVFTNICKNDGYCKYDSIKLDDCLYKTN